MKNSALNIANTSLFICVITLLILGFTVKIPIRREAKYCIRIGNNESDEDEFQFKEKKILLEVKFVPLPAKAILVNQQVELEIPGFPEKIYGYVNAKILRVTSVPALNQLILLFDLPRNTITGKNRNINMSSIQKNAKGIIVLGKESLVEQYLK